MDNFRSKSNKLKLGVLLCIWVFHRILILVSHGFVVLAIRVSHETPIGSYCFHGTPVNDHMASMEHCYGITLCPWGSRGTPVLRARARGLAVDRGAGRAFVRAVAAKADRASELARACVPRVGLCSRGGTDRVVARTFFSRRLATDDDAFHACCSCVTRGGADRVPLRTPT